MRLSDPRPVSNSASKQHSTARTTDSCCFTIKRQSIAVEKGAGSMSVASARSFACSRRIDRFAAANVDADCCFVGYYTLAMAAAAGSLLEVGSSWRSWNCYEADLRGNLARASLQSVCTFQPDRQLCDLARVSGVDPK